MPFDTFHNQSLGLWKTIQHTTGSKLAEPKLSYEVFFMSSNQWWAGHKEQFYGIQRIERFNAIIL